MTPAVPPLPSRIARPRGFDLDRLPRDFGDWRAEVAACRTRLALFDYSCLLTFAVRGPGAVALLESHCARTLSDMPVGAIRYALTADEAGFLRSDLTLWRRNPDHFLAMTGRPEDAAVLSAQASRADRVTVEDRSAETFVLALQGPATVRCCQEELGVTPPAPFSFVTATRPDLTGLVGRIGYSGEDGVEILCDKDTAEQLWHRMAKEAQPCGFRAANLLRLGAGLPLFTHEFAPPVTAAEAGYAHLRRDRGAPAKELTRIRAFARCIAPTALDRFAPARERPAPGEMAITSAVPWRDDGTALVMGYLRDDDASASLPVRDPLKTFTDLRVLPARGRLPETA